MSIALLMQQLRDAGAPMEAILIAVAAVEAVEAKHRDAEETRKADQRERTARCRAKSRDRNVTVTSQQRDPSPKDNNQTPTQPIPPVDPDGSTAPKGADVASTADEIVAGGAEAATAADSEKPEAAPRARRIPADFAESPEARSVCAEMGLSDAEAAEALAEFCDFWMSEGGAKARKLDWPRTLRNRLREVGRRRRPAARASPGRQSSAELWASDAIDAHLSRQRGPDDQGPSQDRRDGARGPGALQRHPRTIDADGSPDGLSGEQSRADPRQLPPLRLVGGMRSEW